MEVEIKKSELEPTVQQETMKVHIDLTSQSKQHINLAIGKFQTFLANIVDSYSKESLPDQLGTITTLKTPCGQGTKTWSRYKLTVYHRRFILTSTHEQLEKIVQFLKNFPHIEINMGIFD